MAFPIITLVFAALVALFAFQTGGIPTGSEDALPVAESSESAPAEESAEEPAAEEE